MLHKTIVFITHDFDESIKLADRIAIMFEGQIVQIGTAEELVTNPATDYVAEFTKNISRSKLLSIKGIMDPPSEETHPDIVVSENDRAFQIAGKVLRQHQDVRVVDSENQVIGSLKREKLLEVLFDDQGQ